MSREIPQDDGPVHSTAGKNGSVRAERESVDTTGMNPGQGRCAFSGGCVIENNFSVLATGRGHRSSTVDGHAGHIAGLPLQQHRPGRVESAERHSWRCRGYPAVRTRPNVVPTGGEHKDNCRRNGYCYGDQAACQSDRSCPSMADPSTLWLSLFRWCGQHGWSGRGIRSVRLRRLVRAGRGQGT